MALIFILNIFLHDCQRMGLVCSVAIYIYGDGRNKSNFLKAFFKKIHNIKVVAYVHYRKEMENSPAIIFPPHFFHPLSHSFLAFVLTKNKQAVQVQAPSYYLCFQALKPDLFVFAHLCFSIAGPAVSCNSLLNENFKVG